jgi:hypothetical protein
MHCTRSSAWLVLLLVLRPVLAEEAKPIEKGQRVFSAGHSFHMFMPGMLATLAKSAGIADHKQAGTSSIGGSYVYQHWNVPDEKNTLKQALRSAEIDVLTLSPIYLPDDGIENFAKLGLEHNPNIRVTIQEFWLPYDVYDINYKKKRPEPVDRNARTVEELRSINGEYFKTMDGHVTALNEKFAKPVVYVVPVGQAAVALREKIIAGEAPGLKQQNDLFTDAIGHATPPLQWLTAYCHFAVIYRRTPVGLACPPAMAKHAGGEPLNTLLQELAWQAVTAHPLAGVK